MDADKPKSALPRRDLLKLAAATTAGWLVRGTVADASNASNTAEPSRAMPPLPANAVTPRAMPTRNLGRTGYRVGLFSLGGQAAIEQPHNEAVAVPLVEKAIDLGVNYIDTSARYGGEADRWSERYIGEVMKRRRGEVFLASKTHDRTRDGSLRLLERSLKLLQTDHLDLWQLHNLSTKQEVDQIFGPGGAIEALTQARDQKMVRCLGLTGHHDPEVLLAALGRFPFDAILLSLNAADRHHLPFTEKLLPAAVEKDMAIIGMKVPSRGRLLGHAGISMREAMRYVLTLPVSTVIIGVDSIAQLQENVEIAQSFTPITQIQMAALEQRVQPLHKDALFYRRWDA